MTESGATVWEQTEITLTADHEYENPYVDVQAWAEFRHESGLVLRRPAFWDGGSTFRIRFAPVLGGEWTWTSAASVDDAGLVAHTGRVTAGPVSRDADLFGQHGFWRMSPGGRSLIHADGTPALMAADTAWALPWRATVGQVQIYAQDRQAKGFNAALLMTVQPDMGATGPATATATRVSTSVSTTCRRATSTR